MPTTALVRAGCSLGIVLVLLTAVLLVDGRPLVGDELVAVVGADPLLSVLTHLGSGAVLYPALAVLAVVLLRQTGSARSAVLPLLTVAAAQMLEAVSFVTVSRADPLGDGSVSFSSGHAMTALLGWVLVAQHVRRRWALPLALAVAVVVGSTRVLLGLHWASDVLAGWAFAGVVLAGYGLVERRTRSGAVPPQTVTRAPSWATSRWAWAVTAGAALVPLVPLLTVPTGERMKDLLVYVGAGGTAGSGADVYDFRTAYDMPFTYPPFAAVLSEPLSRVPLTLLHVLWAAATVVALIAVARVAMAPVVARIGLPVTLAVLLVSSPVRSHLRFGQVGLFLVLLVAVDLLQERRRPGTGIGLAAAVKLTPAVFFLLLVVTRRWRALRTGVLTAVGCTVAGLLVLWPSAQEYLWRALWDSGRFGPNDVPGNQSVRGMLLRTELDERTVIVLWLASAVVLVAVALHGAQQLERVGNRLGAVGVLAALSIAVSPISWVHHLVFLVLPLSALVAARRGRLAAGWALLLSVSPPSLGAAGLRAGGPELFWQLVIDAQGLSAVAAVLLLPWLLRPAAGCASEVGKDYQGPAVATPAAS